MAANGRVDLAGYSGIVRTGDTWSDPGLTIDLSRMAAYTNQIEVQITNFYGQQVGGTKLVCDHTAAA